MDILTACSVLMQGRGKFCFCLQLLQYSYITMQWLYGLTVVLLVQGRGEMTVPPEVTAVLLQHCAMDRWTDCSVLIQGRWEISFCLQLMQYFYITVLVIYGQIVFLLVQRRGQIAVLPAVTAVILHHSAMDKWTDCSDLIHGRGEICFCLQLLQYSFISVLWIYRLTVVY
jgi:hypothetical protein